MTLLGKTCYKILPLPFIMVQAIIGLKLIQEAGQEHTKRVWSPRLRIFFEINFEAIRSDSEQICFSAHPVVLKPGYMLESAGDF